MDRTCAFLKPHFLENFVALPCSQPCRSGVNDWLTATEYSDLPRCSQPCQSGVNGWVRAEIEWYTSADLSETDGR